MAHQRRHSLERICGWSAVAGIVAVVVTGSSSLSSQAPQRSGQFVIYKLQHRVGVETWERRPADSANGASARLDEELAATWQFTYIGSTVRLSEALTRTSDGRPLALRAHGATSTLTDVDLDVDLSGIGVRVVERGRTRSSAVTSAS